MLNKIVNGLELLNKTEFGDLLANNEYENEYEKDFYLNDK